MINLARIQVFRREGSTNEAAEGGASVGGSEGILPWKIFKFQVLGNAIPQF